MEVGWTGSAPHFIYMHHTSLTAPGHLLFCFLCTLSSFDDPLRWLSLGVLVHFGHRSQQSFPRSPKQSQSVRNGGAGGIGQPMSMLMAINPLENEVTVQDVALDMVPPSGVAAILLTWSIQATCSNSPLIHHSLRWISWKSAFRGATLCSFPLVCHGARYDSS